MKEFKEFTEENAKHVCELMKLPFIRFSFIENSDLERIFILHESTLNGDYYDKSTDILKNGEIYSSYNSGNWGGFGLNQFNALPILDYMKQQGFEFKY